jgi:hypothetical protein
MRMMYHCHVLLRRGRGFRMLGCDFFSRYDRQIRECVTHVFYNIGVSIAGLFPGKKKKQICWACCFFSGNSCFVPGIDLHYRYSDIIQNVCHKCTDDQLGTFFFGWCLLCRRVFLGVFVAQAGSRKRMRRCTDTARARATSHFWVDAAHTFI